MTLPEVPAHVQHQNHVQNQVAVQGGTNWDLSRSALTTPIEQLAPPEPVRPAVAVEPVAKEAAVETYAPKKKEVSKFAHKPVKHLKSHRLSSRCK